ncbi:MAG: hypothetical protein R3A45_12575 [Bdellovibrionota bacterium]
MNIPQSENSFSVNLLDDHEKILLSFDVEARLVYFDEENLSGAKHLGSLVEVVEIEHPQAYKYDPLVFTTTNNDVEGKVYRTHWVPLENFDYFSQGIGGYSFFSDLTHFSIKTQGYELQESSFYSESSPYLVISFSDLFSFNFSDAKSEDHFLLRLQSTSSDRKGSIRVRPVYYKP